LAEGLMAKADIAFGKVNGKILFLYIDFMGFFCSRETDHSFLFKLISLKSIA
jgi:hypothetical protein